MEHFKIAFSSLSKRKLASLLLAIQLVISFWMINNSFISMETINYQEKQIFSSSKFDKTRSFRLVVIDGDDTEWFAKRFFQLEEFIKAIPEVESYGSFITTDIIPENLVNQQRYLEKNKKLYADTRMENYIFSSRIIFFDSDIFDYTDFSLIKGRTFDKNDFKKSDSDTIPVLIGYNYIDSINVGDKFETQIENKRIKYEVIGVLEKGQKWLSGNDYIFSPVDLLDNFFIAPFFPIQRQGQPIDVAVRLHNTFIELGELEKYPDISSAIIEKGIELGINPTLKSMESEISNYRESRKQSGSYILFMGIFFLVISVVGIISVTLSSIHARKYELGIRMITGANKLDISLIIIIELSLLVVISAVLGIVLSYILETRNNFFDYNINLEVFSIILYIKVSIVAFFIILTSILIPLLKIKALHLQEMIGGKN